MNFLNNSTNKDNLKFKKDKQIILNLSFFFIFLIWVYWVLIYLNNFSGMEDFFRYLYSLEGAWKEFFLESFFKKESFVSGGLMFLIRHLIEKKYFTEKIDKKLGSRFFENDLKNEKVKREIISLIALVLKTSFILLIIGIIVLFAFLFIKNS